MLVCDWSITSHVTQITRSDWSVPGRLRSFAAREGDRVRTVGLSVTQQAAATDNQDRLCVLDEFYLFLGMGVSVDAPYKA